MGAHSPTSRDSIAAFRRWLKAKGAEVLAPKGAYEVIRFRGESGLSIIYASAKGRATFTGEAAAAWTKFVAGTEHQLERPEAAPPVGHQVSRRGCRAVSRLPAPNGLTIADVMAAARVTARAAHAFLAAEAAAGRLVRSGGGPGQAMRWSAVAAGGREAA